MRALFRFAERAGSANYLYCTHVIYFLANINDLCAHCAVIVTVHFLNQQLLPYRIAHVAKPNICHVTSQQRTFFPDSASYITMSSVDNKH